MQKRDYADLSKSIDSDRFVLKLSAKLVEMAVNKVVSALEVLTSDVPLRSNAWPDSGAFEALITDYFAGSDDDAEESETSDSDHNGISSSIITFKLYTGF